MKKHISEFLDALGLLVGLAFLFGCMPPLTFLPAQQFQTINRGGETFIVPNFPLAQVSFADPTSAVSYTVAAGASQLPSTCSDYSTASVSDSIRGLWGCKGNTWHSLSGHADVTDFGADPTGTILNSDVGINAAITAAAAYASGSGTEVFIPAGSYKTSAPINMASFVRVRGAGLQSTTIYPQTATAGHFAAVVATGPVNSWELSELLIYYPNPGTGTGSSNSADVGIQLVTSTGFPFAFKIQRVREFYPYQFFNDSTAAYDYELDYVQGNPSYAGLISHGTGGAITMTQITSTGTALGQNGITIWGKDVTLISPDVENAAETPYLFYSGATVTVIDAHYEENSLSTAGDAFFVCEYAACTLIHPVSGGGNVLNGGSGKTQAFFYQVNGAAPYFMTIIDPSFSSDAIAASTTAYLYYNNTAGLSPLNIIGGNTFSPTNLTARSFDSSNVLNDYSLLTPGLSCSGTPTSSFASVHGIVTHC